MRIIGVIFITTKIYKSLMQLSNIQLSWNKKKIGFYIPKKYSAEFEKKFNSIIIPQILIHWKWIFL